MSDYFSDSCGPVLELSDPYWQDHEFDEFVVGVSGRLFALDCSAGGNRYLRSEALVSCRWSGAKQVPVARMATFLKQIKTLNQRYRPTLHLIASTLGQRTDRFLSSYMEVDLHPDQLFVLDTTADWDTDTDALVQVVPRASTDGRLPETNEHEFLRFLDRLQKP